MFYQTEIASLSRKLVSILALWFSAYSLEQVLTLIAPADDLQHDIYNYKPRKVTFQLNIAV